MRFWHKLASASVLAAMLIVPAVPLATCATEAAAAAKPHCPPDCPMMAKAKAGYHKAEMKSDNTGSCCNIQKSRPGPVTESKTVPPVISNEPVFVAVSLLTESVTPAFATIDTSPPLALDCQARLCTFQI